MFEGFICQECFANNMGKKYFSIFLFSSFSVFFFSCKNEKKQPIDTSEFILQPGFSIELVASEPLLDSPVAMQFDKKGRIWVVELPGYMRDIDGSNEDLPDGKIIILSDEDQDGQMDKRKIFLDSLIAPRTLAFAYNGLLYSNGKALWWVSIENDRPTKQELVDSLYVVGGNIEHQSNGLLYHLDNWIYSAKSNARYRRKNGQWIKEATTTRGQWGLTQDDAGRLFYNDNSNPLTGDFAMPNVLIENPYQEIKHGYQQQIAIDRRVFPFQSTAVNRGYEEGVLDDSGKLTTFTSACGPLIYLGDQFPEEYYGNAFVCGPEVNLVKRYLIHENGIAIATEQAYQGQEFLVSKDESFRPINIYTGLDGALYIVDLRKGVIQHRAFMTSYLREKILARGLEKITGIGRIYKVVSDKYPANKTTDYSTFKTIDYLPLLNHKNGELRLLAQQAIVYAKDISLKDELVKMALDPTCPMGQIHALWSLEGLGILEATTLKKTLQISEKQEVVSQVFILAAMVPGFETLIQPAFNSGLDDLYLCQLSGKIKNKINEELWVELASNYSNNPVFCEALISGISNREIYFLKEINHLRNDSIYSMLNQVVLNKKNLHIKAPQLKIETVLDTRTEGFKLYNTYCVLCHGQDGKGNPQLAPPLYPSEYVTGPPERMVLIALQGLKGPISVNGKSYDMNLVMPGIKENPDLTDKKIADLMIFIRNSFTDGTPKPVTTKMVKELRASLKDRQALFTVESLKDWMAESN